jgi:uncharacterized protein
LIVLMPDVNVLVYAHRADEEVHAAYRAWLERTMSGPEPVGLSVLVAVGFIRVVTNHKIYEHPTPASTAIAVVDQLAASPACRMLAPDVEHWKVFVELCRATGAKGKLVADAHHAAVAIAEGCTWVTRDGDFSRFASHGLRWQHLVLG